ncbi:MAG: DUF4380 domain-containing protein [Planctomycetaceae bacterium]|nr:DUF4380 domain-containing protein [Planctomycetaceae bacterium]
MARVSQISLLCGAIIGSAAASAGEIIRYHGYTEAVRLENSTTRVVLCPQVGGRVLEYSRHGVNALYLSEAEKNWQPGDRPQSSAGRFDIGPEYIIPKRSALWSGPWTAELTGPRAATLTSQKDAATGVQLIRHFELAEDSSHLVCRQTIRNVSRTTREWCHWSRTFAAGKGICVIPLTDADGPLSRFPNDYVMYTGRGLINVEPSDPAIRRVGNSLQIFPTPAHPKLGFDSYAGEILYLAPSDLLFVKRFRTHPDRVYNEAAGLTISVWYPDREMVELEPIGPRERLAPGESASFTEHWYLGDYPFPGTSVDVNMPQLRRAADALQ